MPAQKTFTTSELDIARSMRADKASWRAIGREIGCNDDTIRCALEPDYLRKRHDAIVAKRRIRNEVAKAEQSRKEAISNTAYGSSAWKSGNPKRLGIHRGNLRGFY